MEILNLTLNAGGIQQYRKAGGYVEIISSTYPVSINFYSQLGGQSNAINGAQSGLFLQANFGGFDINNVGQPAQTVQLLICDVGEIGGSRRQPGNVRVIDSSADKTNAGRQFLSGSTFAATVSKWSIVNLNANGANVALRKVIISSPVAGSVGVGYITAPGTVTTSATAASNKLIGGAVSTARFAANGAASATPTAGEAPGWTQMVAITLSAGVPFVLDLSSAPIIVSGTQGVAVLDLLTGNRQLSAYFEFEEIG